MAVKPLPQKQIEEFINKGAKVVEENKIDEWTMLSLRLPKSLLNQLDLIRKKQIGLSRNAWLLQIIQEKIKENN